MAPRNYGVEVKAYPVTLCWLSAYLASDFFWNIVFDGLLYFGYLGPLVLLADIAIDSHG